MAAYGLTAVFTTAAIASTPKTYFSITAPANQRVKVRGWNLSFNGTVNSSTPITIQFQNATTAGSSQSITPYPDEPEITGDVAPQATCGCNHTGEPTYSGTVGIRRLFYIHPQLGQEVYFPQGQELIVKGGATLGILITAPQPVVCQGWVSYEE